MTTLCLAVASTLAFAIAQAKDSASPDAQDGHFSTCGKASTTALLAGALLIGLIVNFFGYRLYMACLAAFAGLLAAAAIAGVGAAWIGQPVSQASLLSSSDAKTALEEGLAPAQVKTMIVLLGCMLWGSIAAVLALKFFETVHKIIGFMLGAALGAAGVAALIYLMQYHMEIGPEYKGWNHFAAITLTVPAALAVGYLTRHTVAYFLIFATAILGSAAAVFAGMEMLKCAEINSDFVRSCLERPEAQYVAVAVLVGLGVIAQVLSLPKKAKSVVES